MQQQQQQQGVDGDKGTEKARDSPKAPRPLQRSTGSLSKSRADDSDSREGASSLSSSLDDRSIPTTAIATTSWRNQCGVEEGAGGGGGGSWQLVASGLSLSVQSIPDSLADCRDRSSSILSDTRGRPSSPASIADVDIDPSSSAGVDIEEALREATLSTDSSTSEHDRGRDRSNNPFWSYRSSGPETERARKLREIQAIFIPVYQKKIASVTGQKGMLEWLWKRLPAFAPPAFMRAHSPQSPQANTD